MTTPFVSRVLFALVLLLAACDSTADPGPTTSSSSTTTTIENDTCDRVGDDTVAYLEALVDTLDVTRFEEFRDPATWGEDLLVLQRSGKDLDLRVDALRCDAVEIQQRAFAEADLTPGGPLSAHLIDLLLTPSTTTTTTVADTTTTTLGGETTTTADTATGEGTTTTGG